MHEPLTVVKLGMSPQGDCWRVETATGVQAKLRAIFDFDAEFL
jgi:hypothetical protein